MQNMCVLQDLCLRQTVLSIKQNVFVHVKMNNSKMFVLKEFLENRCKGYWPVVGDIASDSVPEKVELC